MSKEQDILATKAFFEGWKFYQTIIRLNYMFHAEIIEHETALLSSLSRERLSVLELGCGDSFAISQVAKSISIDRYRGIDITSLALKYAQKNLERVIPNVELVEGDMFQEGTFHSEISDAGVLGYTAHHLETKAKISLFSRVRKQLRADGILIVYDLITDEGESPEDFLERSIQHFETSWDAFDRDQLASIRDHVSTKDHPESWEGWKSIAEESGYSRSALRFRDPQHIFGIMAFWSRP